MMITIGVDNVLLGSIYEYFVRKDYLGVGKAIMVDGQEYSIQQHIYFSSNDTFSSVSDGALYIPLEPNKKGVDFVMPPILFQVTISLLSRAALPANSNISAVRYSITAARYTLLQRVTRHIKSKTIVKTLINFFALFGLLRSVQSDQSSNFMSSVFQQVMYELGIKQYKSSAYHPESQGAIERFHQVLKTMIKIYCFDNDREWDDGVPLLMFAARESVQESTGFSPIELVLAILCLGHSNF